MAQIGLPRKDLFNTFEWYAMEDVGSGPLWDMIDDYPIIDNEVTYIRTLPYDSLDVFGSAANIVTDPTFLIKRQSGAPLVDPRNTNNHIVHITVAKAIESTDVRITQIRIAMNLEEHWADVDNVVLNDFIVSSSVGGQNIDAIFPEFESFQFPLTNGESFIISDYSSISIEVKFEIVGDGQREQAAFITRLMLTTPKPTFEATEDSENITFLDEETEDDRKVMRAIVNNELKRFRDERVTMDFRCADASETRLGLLNKVSALGLNKWSDLNLQVMSGSINFKENTIGVRITNDIFKEIAYKEIIERAKLREKKGKANQLEQRVKNRNNAFKRVQPYEDSQSVKMGGLRDQTTYFKDIERDGEKAMETPDREPNQPEGLGDR